LLDYSEGRYDKNMSELQNNDKYFVSIGAGINQVPLIREAKNLDLKVIGVDRNKHAAGFALCDQSIVESIYNYEAVYDELCSFSGCDRITGVLSKSFGNAVKTSGFITEKMGLPGIPFNRSDDFIDKVQMKNIFKKSGINTPDFQKYSPDDNLPGFPFVIKPVEGHAKTGVSLISNSVGFSDYEKNIINSEAGHTFMIEEFIEGNEIICAGIISRGRFFIIDISDKVTMPDRFIDLMHISPSKYYYLWDRIGEIGQKIVDAFEITASPLIIELLVARDDKVFVIESVPEFGGEYLCDIVIPGRAGYNMTGESVKAVTGHDIIPPERREEGGSIVVKYLTGSDGTFRSCCPDQIENREGVLFSSIFKSNGDTIRTPVDNHDRLGVVITKGNTREEAIALADSAADDLKIVVE